MTTSTTPRAGKSAVGVAAVASAFSDLFRTVRRAKARQSAAAGDDVDSATQMLLRTVASDGPMRASALAASVQSDLSTVSRQVAVLITRRLLERRADQEDGRASLLVVTEAGEAIIAAHEHVRHAFFEQALEGWSLADRDQFARLLSRFTTAYDHVQAEWLHDPTRRVTTEAKEGSTE